jgi:CRISPR-associated protein Cmr2
VSGYFLHLALGPVQDFIAQARRSRDLWFSSHLLSEISRAAAKSLAQSDARLIFPALEKGDAELEPCDAPVRGSTNQPPVSVANKIFAELREGCDTAALAKEARAAARACWRGIAEGVRGSRASAVIARGSEAVWNEQIEEVLEFYAAWAPLADGPGGYRTARTGVEQALAARKNLREFRPWRHERADAPKSSLDGGRVSVLDDKNRDGREFRRLQISRGEQLDAIGLVKRAGFEPDQFVPLVNIAAVPWLAKADANAGAKLEMLRLACRRREIHRVDRPGLPLARQFPFDASALYPSRWAALFKELDAPEDTAAARAWGEANAVRQ